MSIETVLDKIDANLPEATERLFDLLRIKSISTDPAYAADCAKAADWLAAELSALGFDAAARATPGHPMVVGHAGGSGRHLLFYGHYDVQPVDPLDLWHRDPFDPAIEDTPKGKVIRGRGASDDKGQLMTFIEACRAWKAVHGTLPGRLTVLLEGEEESGSPSLAPFLKDHADELAADLVLVCDTGLFDDRSPAIEMMLRGILALEIVIRGADRDLHSGLYGGPAINPIRVLTRILSDLHDDDGRITLPGFYDDVDELPDDVRAQWQRLNFNHERFLEAVGLSVPAGEQDRTPLEMVWSRPTLDVNGIAGGYAGAGFKTVLPAEARAKLSFRLVSRQDSRKIEEAFRAYVASQLPADCTAEITTAVAAPAAVNDLSDPAFELARAALAEEWQLPASYTGSGGSIPVVSLFKSILGLDSLMVGFGRNSDQIHSPNEKYDVESFHKGMRSWARILHALNA
ncbi:M20/M25/M40 family metallo-hydrolase [Defluviimonas sp. WL0024]|uniref:M20/M25/M40 family metallo-hydrolase n=1 Tax=Albidovulum salinarum TaxID=2984153 RepID=A0ABT2XDF7_9RHOB|nr:M20/M25/M40 family metallo-hydrolase [Defluviimonas sp. WL0024]MCU9849745.1 M20/M25/M40 family metallo-hydrolase [Defluviimonas sp. WL0024]